VTGRRLPRRGEDRGVLTLAMLLIVVGMMTTALMLPTVLSQVNQTRESVRRVSALQAAQAGLDVAMGHIRMADDGTGTGVLALLPCGPFTGNVSPGSSARYLVSVDYFSVDPQGQSDAWIATNRLSCLTGGGTFVSPGYALLRSQGTDTASGTFGAVYTRTLTGTYTFDTTNQNIVGGLIHAYKTATSTDLCLAAGATSPAAGTNVQMQACTAGSSRQKFAYNTNLTLVLVASKTTALPLGMCLDAGTPHASGALVRFQPCATTTLPQQQWSINDSSNFEGSADGTSLDGYCFNVQNANAAGSFVILGTTGASKCKQGYDNVETFQAEASVGAGAAGPDIGQLVNFSEFGRCLDVTEQNVSFEYMIVWPCKQNPNAALVTWNQKWALPTIATGDTSATGRVYTSPIGGPYCLASPQSIGASQYVDLDHCSLSGTLPLNETWKVYGKTGVYATSYTITDSKGYCLSPSDPAARSPDFYPKGQQISKSVVRRCDGSKLQKWNADPNILDALALKDLSEK
jgi:Ricin-type beta-trefoil lectin domain